MVPAQETVDDARYGVEFVVENGRVSLEIRTPRGVITYEVPMDRALQHASGDPGASDLSATAWQALEALRDRVARNVDADAEAAVELHE